MKIITAALLSIFVLTNIFFVINNKGTNEESEKNEKILHSKFADEYKDLLVKQKHYNPNSPLGIRTAEKIKKIEEKVLGEAESDEPGEFVRLLYEMRIPYGEQEPDYAVNYKFSELQKAFANKKLYKGNLSVLPWIERGPGNVSGRARGLIVDPLDDSGNTWYVGSVGGGIWKTTNGGANWRDLTPDFSNLAVSVLAISASNPNIIYAGTGESMYSVDVVNGDGILKSTDHGETWAQLPSTKNNINFNNIARIIVNPSNSDILLAATSTGRYKANIENKSGIYKSTDGGNSWYQVYNQTTLGELARAKKVLQIIETPGNFSTMFATIDERGIIKSTDAGETWFNSSNGIADTTGRFELAISPVNTSKIFAAAEGSPSSNLFVSTDAGNTWVKTSENGSEPNWLSAQGWYDNTIVAHPFNENIVYVGGVELFQIELLADNKRTTTNLETGPVHVDNHNLVIIPGEGTSFRILNANDGGIGVSGNGADNWGKPTLGMNTSQFYGIDKKPGASAYIGGMQDNGTWRSNEDPGSLSLWNFQIGGDGYETAWHFDDPSKIIGGYQYNGLNRSLDGGFSFSNATNGLSDNGSANAPFITKIAKSNMEPDLLFTVGRRGVWKSTNFGGNWSLKAIPASTWGTVSSFHNVKISRANPNIVWAGARMDPAGKIFVSKDKGETFTAAIDYDGTTMGGISGIATHPVNDSTAYVLFSFAHKPKILKTTDLGLTWIDITGFNNGTVSTNGFPDVAVYDLLVLPHTPDTLWAGTEIGLFESTDNGTSWHIAGNGLPNVCIWQMTSVEDEVVVATHGRGIWSVKIPGMANAGTYKPLIQNVSQGPDGVLSIRLNLRSLYDSSVVKINGTDYLSITANPTALKDTVIKYPVSISGNVVVQVISYKNGNEYPSVSKTVAVNALAQARNSYSNSFNTSSEDFFGAGFRIGSETGFDNDAIHTTHPYSNEQNITYTLKIPIIVAQSDAFISFDEVVIAEPGDPGSVFGDDNFWDYVIIEGTKDGLNWIPLEDGYDSRLHPDWLNAFNNNGDGTSALFKKHSISLTNKFTAGDKIIIRFRLYADGFVNGWGWAIDNLEIQENIVSVRDNEIPQTFALLQNYPNPFNPSTDFGFRVAKSGLVTLKIFNIQGKEITTLVNQNFAPGEYHVQFSSAKHALPSGVYFYRIEAGSFTDTKKFVLLK